MNRPLILLGGGGHCKSVIEICRQLNRHVMGILDPIYPQAEPVLGVPVIGNDDDISKYVDHCDFIITVGAIENPTTRISLFNRILTHNGRFTTLIAPSATVASSATIGEGSVVLSGACVNADAQIGRNVIINTLSAVEHDSVVEDHCHISTGAMVNGDCHIGRATFIGSNATTINGITVGANVIIGAGSTVITNIYTPGVYVGSPARLVNKRP
ncbi:MAG: acetyltransferase [Muribaculaceae bacterium]|nr:acetyltransferase [Muribaculaceae bacterium]